MSITATQPATTPIPVQLSETEFAAFILPHLSMPKRGPKCKVGYHCVFNFILRVLYTGMQWKCYPFRKTPTGNPLSITRPCTASSLNGPMMGRSGRRLSPAWRILPRRNTSTSASCMAMGPTPWPKKGGWDWLFGLQTPEGRESHHHHGQQRLRVSSSARRPRQRNRYGFVPRGAESVEAGGQRGWGGPQRRLSQPRWRL